DDTVGIITEAHLYLIADGRLAPAHLVCLPERRYLCGYLRGPSGGLAIGERQSVEVLDLLGDAPALEQDGSSCDLSRVRGEHGDNLDSRQGLKRLLAGHARFTHSEQGTSQGIGLWRALTPELYGPLAPLAMVGLGEVGQFEIDCEGFG